MMDSPRKARALMRFRIVSEGMEEEEGREIVGVAGEGLRNSKAVARQTCTEAELPSPAPMGMVERRVKVQGGVSGVESKRYR